jgi:beta-glucosidase
MFARSHGTGSGDVHNEFVQPPILEFCDKLGVKRFDNIEKPETNCNPTNLNCVTYGGSKNPSFEVINGTSGGNYDTTVIFIGGPPTGEDSDRTTLGFPGHINEMISSYGIKNREKGKKTIVVMSIPGVVTFPWANDVDAIIADFYGGETMSPALLNVIYGQVNPSGKLPVTFQKGEND